MKNVIILAIIITLSGIFYVQRVKSDDVMKQYEIDRETVQLTLKDDLRFQNVSLHRSTNYRHRAKMIGSVKTENDLQDLKQIIANLKPPLDIGFDVKIKQ